MVRQGVVVGKEWAWLEVEAGMMREDWGVGEGIKAVFSCLEESYEPTSFHPCAGGYSALQPPSI